MGGPPPGGMGGPPPGGMGGPPKPAAASAPAADERPPNPMGRGNLLSGIQGFNKNKLKDTDTNDKSAPATANKPGGGGPAPMGGGGPRPGGGGGGAGPFGVPAGGLAAIKAQKAAEQQQSAPAGMFPLFDMLFYRNNSMICEQI